MVVVLNKHDPPLELGLAGEFVHLADEMLAGLVLGVRLAGKHKLDWALRVVKQFEQPFRVAEKQGGPLVSGKPPRESDGQVFGVQQPAHIAHAGGRFANPHPLLADPAADELDEPVFEFGVDGPEFLVGDVINAAPEFRVGEFVLPAREIPVIEV